MKTHPSGWAWVSACRFKPGFDFTPQHEDEQRVAVERKEKCNKRVSGTGGNRESKRVVSGSDENSLFPCAMHISS